MPRWIGFLRAINLGRTRKYPMAELRAVLEKAGYTDVATHLQSGNIALTAPTRSAAKLEQDLEALFEADRGFELPTIVCTPAELRELGRDIVDVVTEHGAPEFGHYVEILRAPLAATDIAAIESQSEGQRAVVRGRAVHLLYDIPFKSAKGFSAAAKRVLGDSTNRNAKVITTLAEKWGAE